MRLLAPFLLLFAVVLRAAQNPVALSEPLTAKELAQGYRDRILLAQPRVSARATVDAAEAREGVRVRRKYARFGDLRIVELDATDTPAAALARLRATGRYAFVEPDYIRTASVVPSDPKFSTDQWPLQNTGASAGIAGADIKAVPGWDILHDAPNVIVAVIDSGIRATHEDINLNLWTNPGELSSNGLDDDHDGYIDDVHGINAIVTKSSASAGNPNDDLGHGSHVAGIIGATGNNGVGITGVAWRVKIMALKFLDSSGNGAVSDEVECFDYAIAHGASIINGSFGDTTGSSTFSQTELAAITRARDAGIIFVAAAGNDATNMDITRHYPASFPLDNIVSVGSSDNRDQVSTFSNYGSGAVELFAPGENILSLDYTADNKYVLKSGTSMAAPHVAGVLALLKAKFPTDTYRQLINRLLRSVDTNTPGAKFAGKCQTGGRLNLANALASTDNRPFNDDFGTRAHVAGTNLAVRASNTGATRESGEPVHAGVAGGASLWWEWTAPAGGSVTVDTNGSGFDTTLAVYTGTTLASLVPVAANDDSSDVTSRVTFTAQAGVTYEFAVDGKGGATGLVLLNLGTVPANDSFASPVILTGVSATVTATNSHCSRETGEPKILNYSGGLSLWYSWTAPHSGQFQISAFSDQIDPLLAVYTGTSLTALTLVSASDNTGPNSAEPSSLCTINATSGTTYLISVDSKDASVPGTFTLSLVDSLWQAVTTDGVTGSPAIAADGSVYVGSNDDSVYAFNADGTAKWSYATGGYIDTCSPAIADDGTVYAGSNDGKVRAFSATGTLKWTFTVPTPADTSLSTSISNSPALATDGTIYIQSTDHYLYALNPADGMQKWRHDTGSIGYATPVIAPDGTLYLGSSDNHLYALNPADGSVRWTFTANNQIYTTPAIDADGNLYFGTLGTSFYSITSGGVQRWKIDAGNSITSSPALSADGATVYFGSYDHLLYAVNAATGATRWTYTLGDEVRASSPAVDANGTIYIGGYDNLLHAVSPAGALIRTYAMGGWVRSSPVIAGTKLYVGSNDHKVYAFELGVGPAAGPWPMYRQNARRLGRVIGILPPIISAQPQGHTVALGSTAVLSVTATGSNLTYQWKKDGNPIAGATAASILLTNMQAADAGGYTVVVSGTGGGTVTSAAATLSVNTSTNPGHLVNLSVRGFVGTGNQVLIMGFVTGGDGTSGNTSLLARAVGPSVIPLGVTDAITDPTLTLIPQGAPALASNDNWGGTTALKNAFATTGAFALLSDSSKDAALVQDFPGNVYSIVISDTAGATGSVVAELYDAGAALPYNPATPRLVNISARGYIGANGSIIPGFVIQGDTALTVLVRAIGPNPDFATALGSGNIPDPILYLYHAHDGTSDTIYVNDNWGGDPQLTAVGTRVGASPLSDPASKDAAILITLDPGVYSAGDFGVNGATGITLVEVYAVP